LPDVRRQTPGSNAPSLLNFHLPFVFSLIFIPLFFCILIYVSVNFFAGISTRLYAHHVNKKITKRMMHRRPKKSRPSDQVRNNINMDKCITKVEGAPAEYTILSASDAAAAQAAAADFWANGDSAAEWLTITEEDKIVSLSPNREPLPEGGVQKRPPLLRSGSH
jgi:hypothetical protein